MFITCSCLFYINILTQEVDVLLRLGVVTLTLAACSFDLLANVRVVTFVFAVTFLGRRRRQTEKWSFRI